MQPIKHAAFYEEVALALGDCQLVELGLKFYITEAFAKIRRSLGEQVVFKFRGQDYDDASLERLIEVFKKLNRNTELVRRLNAFKKDRNFLAHQGIVSCHGQDGQLNDWEVAGARVKMDEIRREANELSAMIFNEIVGLFDVVSDIPIPPDAT